MSTRPTRRSSIFDEQRMTSFDFQPRPRVVFGVGAIRRLGDLVSELGCSRALLVSDPGVIAAGHPGEAISLLNQAGIDTFLFGGVEANPTTEHVNAGLEFAEKCDIDIIIGLGGGRASSNSPLVSLSRRWTSLGRSSPGSASPSSIWSR